MLLSSERVLARENLERPRLRFENSKTFVASNKVGAEKKRGDEPCTRQLTNRWPVRDGEWGNKQVIEREGKMQNHKNTGILHFSASMSVSLTLSPLLHVFFSRVWTSIWFNFQLSIIFHFNPHSRSDFRISDRQQISFRVIAEHENEGLSESTTFISYHTGLLWQHVGYRQIQADEGGQT